MIKKLKKSNIMHLCFSCISYLSFGIEIAVDCKTVHIFAYSVKQKVWNEAENREQDWRETLKIRSVASHALRACEARETLTPRFTDFFIDFEKETTVLQSKIAGETKMQQC